MAENNAFITWDNLKTYHENIEAELDTKADSNHTHTATDIGLGNVENKSSDTIRSELTVDNVTNALGFTPMEDTTVPITKGGTGATTAENARTNLFSDIAESTVGIVDDTEVVFKYQDNSKGVLFFKKSLMIWNYIKDKISSVLGLTATQYNGNAKTATTATTATKVNNHTVESDVPADAVFTDTTYSDATTSANGLMTSDMVIKLNNLDDISKNIPSKIVCGVYTGDGTESHLIDLGFKPLAVVISAELGQLWCKSHSNTGYIVLDGYAGCKASTTYKRAEIVDNGFKLLDIDINYTNRIYYYIAFASYTL